MINGVTSDTYYPTKLFVNMYIADQRMSYAPLMLSESISLFCDHSVYSPDLGENAVVTGGTAHLSGLALEIAPSFSSVFCCCMP